jgi:hypothetical protein
VLKRAFERHQDAVAEPLRFGRRKRILICRVIKGVAQRRIRRAPEIECDIGCAGSGRGRP